MNAWILVMYIYAGAYASGDSVTLTQIDGFSSQSTCQAAGEQGKSLVKSSSKDYRFVCVQRK